MKLGFEESQTQYASGSQSARAWTERWVKDCLYCPHCGSANIDQLPANRPVADFVCPACDEEYELKSQKTPFGSKVLDGAFRTMCERLASTNNPNFVFLNYDRTLLRVRNVFVVPKHFFVREIIEERKPLADTARRAGWIGCNILLSRIPSSGKVFFVQNGNVLPKNEVLSQWRKTLFLRDERPEIRGWLIEVMKCVEQIGRDEFDLDDVYAFESQLALLYPNNRHVKHKIRQQLQKLRDRGYLEFVSRGNYRLRSQVRFETRAYNGLVLQPLQMRSLRPYMDRRMVMHVRRRLPALRRSAYVAARQRGPVYSHRRMQRRIRRALVARDRRT